MSGLDLVMMGASSTPIGDNSGKSSGEGDPSAFLACLNEAVKSTNETNNSRNNSEKSSTKLMTSETSKTDEDANEDENTSSEGGAVVIVVPPTIVADEIVFFVHHDAVNTDDSSVLVEVESNLSELKLADTGDSMKDSPKAELADASDNTKDDPVLIVDKVDTAFLNDLQSQVDSDNSDVNMDSGINTKVALPQDNVKVEKPRIAGGKIFSPPIDKEVVVIESSLSEIDGQIPSKATEEVLGVLTNEKLPKESPLLTAEIADKMPKVSGKNDHMVVEGENDSIDKEYKPAIAERPLPDGDKKNIYQNKPNNSENNKQLDVKNPINTEKNLEGVEEILSNDMFEIQDIEVTPIEQKNIKIESDRVSVDADTITEIPVDNVDEKREEVVVLKNGEKQPLVMERSDKVAPKSDPFFARAPLANEIESEDGENITHVDNLSEQMVEVVSKVELPVKKDQPERKYVENKEEAKNSLLKDVQNRSSDDVLSGGIDDRESKQGEKNTSHDKNDKKHFDGQKNIYAAQSLDSSPSATILNEKNAMLASEKTSNDSVLHDFGIENANNEPVMQDDSVGARLASQTRASVRTSEQILRWESARDAVNFAKLVQQAGQDGVNKLTVRLNPEILGKLEIQLTDNAGKLSIRIMVSSEESRNFFNNNGDAIRQQLQEKGIHIETMDFEFSDTMTKDEMQEERDSAKSNRKRRHSSNGQRGNTAFDSENSESVEDECLHGVYA